MVELRYHARSLHDDLKAAAELLDGQFVERARTLLYTLNRIPLPAPDISRTGVRGIGGAGAAAESTARYLQEPAATQDHRTPQERALADHRIFDPAFARAREQAHPAHRIAAEHARRTVKT